MKLFHSPGSCSLGIHILLEEIGCDYDLEIINLANREQISPAYLSVNPKGKVPALLRDDGSLLTEFQTIAFWLAKSYPEARLIADDLEGQVRTLEALDYIVASVHMRGFTLLNAPAKFHERAECQEELREYGQQQVETGLAQLATMLGEKAFLMGDFSIADAALFYVCVWGQFRGVVLPDPLPAYVERMRARPAVQRAGFGAAA